MVPHCPANCNNSFCDDQLHCISCKSSIFGNFCSEHCVNNRENG